jgi:predicted GNAT superfamily acetyltransferase
VRIEIPENIQAIKEKDLEEAAAWRASTRRAFEHYLGLGYRIEAFYRDDRDNSRCFYGLEKD